MGKKGFGKPAATTQNQRIENARKFILAFQKHDAKVLGQPDKLHRFFLKHLDKLDESLLELLPLVFDRWTAHQTQDEQRVTALMFANFGKALYNSSENVGGTFPRESRALNQELSLTAYQQALKICTREAFPKDWAIMQTGVGDIYSERIRGERAENLEEAIAAFELSLQVLTRERFLGSWIEIQNTQGNMYGERVRGERAENLEKAIAIFELALQVATPERFPIQRAVLQNNLSRTYIDRLEGDPVENLKQAIATLEPALSAADPEHNPVLRQEIVANLAEAVEKLAALIGDTSEATSEEIAAETSTEISEAVPEEASAVAGDRAPHENTKETETLDS